MNRVLVTDYSWESLDAEREVLERAGAELVPAAPGSELELRALAGDVSAIMTNWRPVTAEVLEAAPRCLVVARYGVGLDNIAVDTATRLGMVVTNVPDYCVDEVAEHALALILGLRRRIVGFAGQTASGGWDNQAFGPMHRIAGQTLGLVGTGRLARGLASRAAGLGLEVIGYSRSGTPGAVEHGIRIADSLDDLLARSDIVSLHVPLNEQTRHMIGAPQLALMKPGAILINTARGPIVDTAALADSVHAGEIAGAGIDVLPSEPPDPGDPLLAMENVIVTPHAAFLSVESTADLQVRTAARVADVLLGRRPEGIVNPEVLRSPALRATALREATP